MCRCKLASHFLPHACCRFASHHCCLHVLQWAHFLAWPVLGTGILLALSPSHDQMADTLRKSGLAGTLQML